jgi:Flp pilus assembly protein TadG
MVRRAVSAIRPCASGRWLRLLPRPLARRFGADRSGLAALEFALLLPLMVALYLGGVEISDALTIKRKVTSVTSSLSDLVTQAKVINDKDMNNIFDATASIITPYDEGKLRIKVSGVAIDSKGKATVAWSDAHNDTPLAKNSVVTLPAGVNQKDSFIVTTEVHYDYKPTFGYVLTGSFDLKDQFYLRPRLSAQVDRVP